MVLIVDCIDCLLKLSCCEDIKGEQCIQSQSNRALESKVNPKCYARQTGKLAPQHQTHCHAIGVQKVQSVEEDAPQRYTGPRGNSRTSNECGTTAPKQFIVGAHHGKPAGHGWKPMLVGPVRQGQAAATGFWSKKEKGYTDNYVAFVQELCHVFEPRFVPEIWREWGMAK